jgi:hypothetical protein
VHLILEFFCGPTATQAAIVSVLVQNPDPFSNTGPTLKAPLRPGIKVKPDRTHFNLGSQALDLLFELSIETNDEAYRDFADRLS